jgi:hypothetical protein
VPSGSGRPEDPRDQLLALLLPDPQRALGVVAAAENARDGARRARRELQARSAELDAAAAELVAQGLSPVQVRELLSLHETEGPLLGRHDAG